MERSQFSPTTADVRCWLSVRDGSPPIPTSVCVLNHTQRGRTQTLDQLFLADAHGHTPEVLHKDAPHKDNRVTKQKQSHY